MTVTFRRDVFRSWLKISGYTQSRLASELNVSRGRISQLLNSKEAPSNRIIAGFLKVTHLPFERLFAVKQRNNGGRNGRADRRGQKRPDGSGRRRSDGSEGEKR